MKNKFGENLRTLRIMNKLSQQDLSNKLGLATSKLGLATSTISMYENGNREPNINRLINIATYFNISLDQLIGLVKLQH